MGLRWCIMLKGRKENGEKLAKHLLGRGRVLGDFGARNDVAKVFGSITSEDHEAIDAIREIRNAFMHRAFKIRIDDELLGTFVKRLAKYVKFRMAARKFQTTSILG